MPPSVDTATTAQPSGLLEVFVDHPIVDETVAALATLLTWLVISGSSVTITVSQNSRDTLYASLTEANAALLGIGILSVTVLTIATSSAALMSLISDAGLELVRLSAASLRGLAFGALAFPLLIVIDSAVDRGNTVLLLCLFVAVVVALRTARILWLIKRLIGLHISSGRTTDDETL